MTDLNTKQYKIAAKMWLSSLIEAIGDSYIDEPGICTRLTNEQLKLLQCEITNIAMNIRGSWPVKRNMNQILNYLTGVNSEEE